MFKLKPTEQWEKGNLQLIFFPPRDSVQQKTIEVPSSAMHVSALKEAIQKKEATERKINLYTNHTFLFKLDDSITLAAYNIENNSKIIVFYAPVLTSKQDIKNGINTIFNRKQIKKDNQSTKLYQRLVNLTVLAAIIFQHFKYYLQKNGDVNLVSFLLGFVKPRIFSIVCSLLAGMIGVVTWSVFADTKSDRTEVFEHKFKISTKAAQLTYLIENLFWVATLS